MRFSPASTRRWKWNAASATSRWGYPRLIAATIPPISSIFRMYSIAFSSISFVNCSRKNEPPSGSMVLATPDSSAMICWVRSATVTACSVGSANVSSIELVWSDCVPPRTPDRAWRATRTTLFIGCCAVRVQPAVWVWNRSFHEFSSFAWNRPRLHVGDPVPDRERQLLDRRGPRLADVVAADADRVPLRDVVGAVAEDVGDDPHRRLGGKDPGVLGDVLLEDVVLDRSADLVEGNSLLLGDREVHREDHRRGAVDRHRSGDLVQRDPVEQDLHVLQGIHRDAAHPHLSL